MRDQLLVDPAPREGGTTPEASVSGVLFVGNFLTGQNRGYSQDLADRIEARGWRVVRTSSQSNRALRLADMVRTTWVRRADYEAAQVDVFSGPSFVWAEAVCLALRALRKPFILTLHGGNLPEFAKRWPRRVRRLLASAALVTVPSAYLGERMHDYRRDLTLLRNAVDTVDYAFTPRVHPRPRAMWVRAFHAIYNPVLAVEVLARLGHRHVTLSMIGPDRGSRAEVERRAAELGVVDRLTIVGPVPRSEIARHLAEADVFLNTTNIDNTPLSLLEAMSAGLCVVTTSVGGIPFLVDHERSALLVPPRDAPAMSAAVERVLDEDGLASKLSHNGHARAKECDWTPVLAQWESAFSALGAGRC